MTHRTVPPAPFPGRPRGLRRAPRLAALVLPLAWSAAPALAEPISSSDMNDKENFSSLEEALQKPDEVYKLDLSFQDLTAFPMDILKFKNLQWLLLHENKIKTVPDELAQLQNLTDFHCSGCGLTEFPAALLKLPHMTEIELGDNEIQSVPKEVANLAKLEKLKIAKNKLSSLPEELMRHPKLEEVGIAYNQFEVLPDVDQLPEFYGIDIRGNPALKLPVTIATGRRSISLNNMRKLDLEDSFAKLAEHSPDLDVLYLEGMVTGSDTLQIPENIAELKKLHYLDLTGNRYAEDGVERLFGILAKAPALDDLNVRNSSIEQLPANVSGLKGLKKLSVSGNKLKSVPKELAELQALTVLNLGGNQLATLPEGLAKLQNLKELDLARNQFEKAPAVLGELVNLEKLDLGDNDLLDTLPSLEKLTKLKTLDLGDTNMPQAEIDKLKKQFPKARIDFSQSRRAKEKEKS